MRSSHTLDRLATSFDERRLIADAGLLLPATLAQHLGLQALFDQHVDLAAAAGFYDALGGLGPLAAVVLVQLPPKMKYEAERAERFFRQIARRRRRHALEPRDGSWLTDEALAHLRRRRVALCIATGVGRSHP